MKKILYIDNRAYGHNADIHIDFISTLNDNENFQISAYGNYISKYFKDVTKVPLKSNDKIFGIHDDIDVKKSNLILDFLIKRINPDLILTYNCNGSSYDVGLDNVSLYKWISEKLSKIDIPKYHISTDYCRSGFRQEQADWFVDIGYSAAFFRHKESLKYPIAIPSYWLPFSINKNKYNNRIIKEVTSKDKKVGFIGAAHNSSRELYSRRVAAIDFLQSKDMLKITKVLDLNFNRKMLIGDEYIDFLTKNLFNLTCGGTCNYFTAKYIQIPAAYSMLVCSDTNGLESFPKDTYIKYEQDGMEKLYQDIVYHVENQNITSEKINTLYSFVMNNYAHSNIIKQFALVIDNHV